MGEFSVNPRNHPLYEFRNFLAMVDPASNRKISGITLFFSLWTVKLLFVIFGRLSYSFLLDLKSNLSVHWVYNFRDCVLKIWFILVSLEIRPGVFLLKLRLFIENHFYSSKSRNVKIQIMYKYYHTRTQKPSFETWFYH